jgi:four helix bundle protein
MEHPKEFETDNKIAAEVEDVIENYNIQKDFTTLEAWKKVRIVKLYFYNEIIPLLPSEEKFNLNLQIRKACVSGTANISEGYGRFHYQEGIQFYRIARGSLYELKDHLITCYDLNFINNPLFVKGISLIEDSKVILNGYIKFVKSQKDRTNL